MRANLTRPTCWLLSCLFLSPGCSSSGGGDSSGAIGLPEDETSNSLPFACSQVIGFSQTNHWFTGGSNTDLAGFQAIVDNDRWQLLFRGGAGVEEWSDPNFVGWDRSLVAPCTNSADKPDRVLLTITGNLGDVVNDPQVWADEIDRAITTITTKYDSVRQVLLQPVVGGPNDSVCTFDGQEIRASVNHPVIDQAIERAVTNHSVDVAVAAGFSPTVAVCSDYLDTLGHLTPMASDAVGREIGLFYVDH